MFAVDPKRNYEVTAKNTREKTCVGETLEKKMLNGAKRKTEAASYTHYISMGDGRSIKRRMSVLYRKQCFNYLLDNY